MPSACRPFKGKSYEECWNHTKDWFPNCKHMTLRKYKKIRAALHWTDNETYCKDEDTLYKVRSMINMLEMTIGKYVTVGSGIALDETCIVCTILWPKHSFTIMLQNHVENITANYMHFVRIELSPGDMTCTGILSCHVKHDKLYYSLVANLHIRN